jgi:hypothetical protein
VRSKSAAAQGFSVTGFGATQPVTIVDGLALGILSPHSDKKITKQ